MNLSTFKTHIKTVDHATLDSYHDQISAKLASARTPATRLGYSLALDELSIESQMRANPVSAEIDAMSIDELAAALES